MHPVQRGGVVDWNLDKTARLFCCSSSPRHSSNNNNNNSSSSKHGKR